MRDYIFHVRCPSLLETPRNQMREVTTGNLHVHRAKPGVEAVKVLGNELNPWPESWDSESCNDPCQIPNAIIAVTFA